MIKLDISRTKLTDSKILEYKDEVKKYDLELEKMSKKKKEMVGWMFLPENYDKEEYSRIKSAAKKIRKNSDVLIVIGIGGSYLGAKAVIDIFKSSLNKKEKETEVIFAGNNMSTKYMNDIIEYVSNKDFSINVISKSGTTTEPGIAFRILREVLLSKYGIEGAKERIFVTTDAKNGGLKKIALEENFETFVIPNNIGGRYSVLSPVGLLPIEAAGINTEKILKGAENALNKYLEEEVLENDAYKYAVIRHILNSEYNKDIELMVSYEPSFLYFIEWLKQLFNESEGKDGKGIFTCGSINTTDLHSIGQNIQEGKRNIFETVININDMKEEHIILKAEEADYDELNYLDGKTLDYINKTAMEATMNAHLEGNVPNVFLTISKLNEENIGELIYFFEKACAMYCMLNKVNPFDQPGVEKYKKNMFTMLGKYNN
ncbi:MAG: glucose-6-phosphate isomerase [Clostridiales bacterium]|nr:glucose-6-phosphate isomerase [Clostridiales bacterium]